MEFKIKKNDWILLAVMLTVSLLLFLFGKYRSHANADRVIVKVNGTVEAVCDLSEDREISINDGSNRLKIKDGKVMMDFADCPDQICVKHRAISKSNEAIICLPNKVVIEIDSDEENELDSITD